MTLLSNNKLFISYPHKPEQCVQHVVMALKNRLVASGFDVWLDERIKTGHDWRQEITKGLQESEWVLVFLNSHSTRKDSICLDEIAMAARYKRGQIVSVLLESEEAIKTPLVLGRIQFLKMEEWEKQYKADKGGAIWNAWLQEQADELIAAFERRTDLMQRSELDLLHEILQPDQYWDEIAHRLDGFVGRDWIINEVTQKLKDPDGPRMLWLNGGPGIGKTSIAARLAHDLELPAAGVYFCRFDRAQTHSAHNVIRTLAYQMACTVPAYRQILIRQLHIPIDSALEKIQSIKDELNKQTVYQLFKKLLIDPTYIGGEPHLLIIDGLDEITTEGCDNEIAKLLAGQEFRSMQKWLRILITSRPDALLKEILSSVESTAINAQSTENLTDLREYLELQTCLGKGEIRNQAIETLLARSEGAFGYISKAIDAINSGMLSPEQPEQFPVGLKELYRKYLERAYPNGRQFKEDARPLLELIIAAPEPLPVDVAIASLEVDSYYINEFVAAMGALLDIDLLEQKKRLSFFHRSFVEWLTHTVPPYNVDTSNGRLNLAKTLWHSLVHEGIFSRNGFVADALPAVMISLSKEQLRKVIGDPNAIIIELLIKTIDSLEKIYKFKQAIDLCSIYLFEIELLRGAFHIDTALALEKFAKLLWSNGDYLKAEPIYRRALIVKEAVLGPQNPDIACILNDIGRFFNEKGDYEAAELNFCRALEIREQVLGVEHSDTATTLSNLAGLIGRVKGDNPSSESLNRKVLAIKEKVLGPEHPETAIALNNLAVNLTSKGDYVEAESLLLRALAIHEKTSGLEHSDTAHVLNNLAEVLVLKNDYNGAESLHRKALLIKEKTFGPNHQDTALTLNNLAGLLHSKGDYVAAEALHRRALKIRQHILGPEHLDTAVAFNDLAVLLTSKSDYIAAEPLFRKALEIHEKVLGHDHQNTATAFHNLSEFLKLKSDNAYNTESLFIRLASVVKRLWKLITPWQQLVSKAR